MIKHLLISGVAIAISAIGADAKTLTYTTENLGEVTAISANGEYASIYDYEDSKAYLWSRATGEFTEISEPKGTSSQPSGQRVSGTWAMGVADDGTVVGCIIYADGRQYPSIYKEGKWTRLPIHSEARYDNTAIAITGDGKIIGGYQFINDPSSSIKGRYYPCRWTLKDDGTYELTAYTDLKLPNHQGFYPTCMTHDGSAIGGTVYAGIASTLPAIVTADGEMMLGAKIEEKEEPWIYKGKYYCGTDENGKQIWSDDPNDPRIVLFTETYIDGVKDQGQDGTFNGGFQGADAQGNFYGARTVASNVHDGEGTLSSGATIYNSKTGEWTDNFTYQGFTNGIGKYIFATGNTLLVDGKPSTFTAEFGFSYPRSVSAMYKVSGDGKVIGGNLYEVNPASGEPQFFPFIIVLDEPLVDPSAVSSVETGNGARISVAAGNVTVEGAASVAVYDLNGRLVGNSASTSVQPGIYVVLADGKASKVLVK